MPTGPGIWQPTPPGMVETPSAPLAGSWTPWVLSSGDECRPAPPPAYGSKAWQAELRMVQEIVANLSFEQRRAAIWWGTASPAVLLSEWAQELIGKAGLDSPHAAQVLADMYVATADAIIAVWDAKYTWWTSRPITEDPKLETMVPTPPYPSYPSGYSAVMGSGATVVGHYFPEAADEMADRAWEAAASRGWAGVHYVLDDDVGLAMGRQIGRMVCALPGAQGGGGGGLATWPVPEHRPGSGGHLPLDATQCRRRSARRRKHHDAAGRRLAPRARRRAMTSSTPSRRTMLKGGAALAGLSALRLVGPTHAFGAQTGGEVIPWLDQPDENPVPEVIVRQLEWEELDDWLTPPDQFFVIKHFNLPELTESDWRLEIGGLVGQPMTLTLADLKGRERQEVTFTLECSGNTAFPFNPGLVGNAVWAGTPLATLLDEAGVADDGIEVVFWGADAGEQVWREVTVTEQFARSMSTAEIRDSGALIVYEMNGAPLPPEHGFPARLIVPGWYGVANVKWLTRIEVRDSRYQGHFMARDYVTIREEEVDGETVWTFTSWAGTASSRRRPR
jgi:DMSO/TMAO reductase YedYZ molybdopterin-dependent catalytic subunit/membrane-associated phospholipid phosphatase